MRPGSLDQVLTQVGTEGEKRVYLAPQGAGFFRFSVCLASQASSDRIPALEQTGGRPLRAGQALPPRP